MLNGVSIRNYRVVYSIKAASDVIASANELARFISTTTGYNVTAVKDNAERSEYEILVGGCDREEISSLGNNMKGLDYIISLKGTKLVVAGGSNRGTVNACADFIKYVYELNKEGTVSLSAGDIKTYTYGEYLIGSIMIGDNNIKDYKIVYEADNKLAKLGIPLDK